MHPAYVCRSEKKLTLWYRHRLLQAHHITGAAAQDRDGTSIMVMKFGTAKGEAMYGTSGADWLYGLTGSDRIYGSGADDLVDGGEGDDGLYGQSGNDQIFGQSGVDKLVGEAGNDQLYGGLGNDWLSGGTGNDVLFGQEGSDTLRAEDGNDLLFSGVGERDDLAGGNGNDLLVYEEVGMIKAENNVFNGGGGSDILLFSTSGTTISSPNGVGPAVVRVDNFDSTHRTVEFMDQQSTTFTRAGTHSGIETFVVNADVNLVYSGGNTGATVVGGSKVDIFSSGSASETFNGNGGADQFHFDTWGAIDYIQFFNKDEGDVIVSTLWNGEDGIGLTRTLAESNGHTYINSYDTNGDIIHQIGLVGVTGVTEDIFRDGNSWYGEIA